MVSHVVRVRMIKFLVTLQQNVVLSKCTKVV
jgi:hypothetical protein